MFVKLCNFEQSCHFGQCTIRNVRQSGHGLVSTDSIDVRTLTTALLSLCPEGSPCQAGLTEFGLFLALMLLMSCVLEGTKRW